MLNQNSEVSQVDLTPRRQRILRAVVENYIETAEPVGSKAIAKLAHLDCSSATIRNDMAALEKMGYLEQPHTSAGRIPSAKGYRIYVNELMEEHKLSLQETERINESLHLKMRELDRVIDQAGKLVSQFTNYPAFAMAAGKERVTITRYDLLMIDQNSFICVAMTNSNVVKNKLFHLPSNITEPQLQLLNALLNISFTNKTLSEFSSDLMETAQKAAGSSYGLISLVVSFAMDVLQDAEQSSIHTAGASHLLEHPEYQDVEKAHKLLDYLSDDKSLLPYAQQGDDDGAPKVLIGPENVAEELKDTSVVMATYDIGDGMRGVIGVVGPTRMDYAQITAKLSYMADNLSKLFGNQLPQAPQPKSLNPPKEPGGEGSDGSE
ncbi:MAG: heat-inducible transcriptional repressor HrcA [Clostridiales bacterium]|nr:heat-inducible transcriptional repressor HrcA [Clostridiales bacterium]